MQVSNKIIAAMLLYVSLQMVGLRLVAATAAYDLVVVDADTNQPIKGVDVVAWFSNSNGWKAWTESAPEYEDKKTTDENGLCHLKGETNNGRTGVNIHHPPEGFYPNSFYVRHQFTQKPLLPLMHWRPTDLVITAKLQRVEHPVPLFAKRMGRKLGDHAIAANGEFFAYDLVKGAFLPPFGEGQTADIVFSRLPEEYLGEGMNSRGTERLQRSMLGATLPRARPMWASRSSPGLRGSLCMWMAGTGSRSDQGLCPSHPWYNGGDEHEVHE